MLRLLESRPFRYTARPFGFAQDRLRRHWRPFLSTTNNLTSKTYLYTFDANGNVGQLVESSTGTIAAHYEYDAFGNTLVSAGSEAENNVFRFSTKYYDVETGLYYYGYRYYSPKLGRWSTRDPLEEEGGINLYVFVENSPINLLDTLGLAVHLAPLNGRAENHSSEVITIRGDWYVVTCKKDSTTVTKRPWSEAEMRTFIAWKVIRGYTCTKTIGSDTYQLEPGKSMVSEWDAENTYIVDSDHWIDVTNFTVYKDKKCCEEEKENEIKIGPGILRVYDCPKKTKNPNDTGRKGLYYDIDVNWIPGI